MEGFKEIYTSVVSKERRKRIYDNLIKVELNRTDDESIDSINYSYIFRNVEIMFYELLRDSTKFTVWNHLHGAITLEVHETFKIHLSRVGKVNKLENLIQNDMNYFMISCINDALEISMDSNKNNCLYKLDLSHIQLKVDCFKSCHEMSISFTLKIYSKNLLQHYRYQKAVPVIERFWLSCLYAPKSGIKYKVNEESFKKKLLLVK